MKLLKSPRLMGYSLRYGEEHFRLTHRPNLSYF